LLLISKFIYKAWLKEREPSHSVRDIPRYTLFVEDAERPLIIFRTRDVLLVVSLIRKSESIIGLRRLDREKDKVMEDRLMLRRLLEEPKMDLDIILLQRLSQENKIDKNSLKYLLFYFLYFFLFFLRM
jgi:hypothetical protein